MNPTFETTHARRSDPATSHMAAKRAKRLAEEHKAAILSILRKHGPLGKDGIARHSSGALTGPMVDRRTKEMARCGFIVLTGRNVTSDAGRPEREWMAFDESFAAMGDAARQEMLERGYGS